ncbi:hypothetical protein BST61_g8897 [Cercospora zeina]
MSRSRACRRLSPLGRAPDWSSLQSSQSVRSIHRGDSDFLGGCQCNGANDFWPPDAIGRRLLDTPIMAAAASLEPLGGSTVTAAPTTDSAAAAAHFRFPSHASFPPFYTLQPNLTTRARQLELWSRLVTSYCAHHRLFRLTVSSPPPDLFASTALSRSLKPADVRAVLDYMSQPANGPRAEWIAPTARGETSSACYIYWKTPAEWADLLYAFVEDTGQKGAVLTFYELREGDASRGQEWGDIDETVLRKALHVLVKRGKAQIFGQEDSAGVKFF